jgi:ATP-dependent helicase HrpA
MIRDRFKLRKLLGAAEASGRDGHDNARQIVRFEEFLARSAARATARRAALPELRFDDQLPITAHRQQIAEALAEQRVIVVCGETGSGKSTQLPKICLQAGLGIYGMIGHTQPRRIAARTIATRLAEELGCPLGRDVGYKIRFADQTDPQTYVKLMTDGILLAETQSDRFLEQY